MSACGRLPAVVSLSGASLPPRTPSAAPPTGKLSVITRFQTTAPPPGWSFRPASIVSTGRTVTLSAGDNMTIDATDAISAATTLTLNIDFGNADATGETLTIGSGAVLTAPGGAILNGDSDLDTFNFAPQASTAIVV